MFKRKQKKQNTPKKSMKYEGKTPNLREIEEMFTDGDYPLKGKKPYKKI